MPLTSNVFTPDIEPNIDQETLNDKLGFKPHSDGQREYVYSTARFNIPCCGRRWGKSLGAGHRVTYKTFVPESYNWIVGPTYSLGEKEFRVVWRDFEKLGLMKYCRKSYAAKQGDMVIRTPWGSVLEVKSAEKQDGLLGEGLYHACMSEAARHSMNTWEQYIEPALSDMRGSADFPSTPKGYNWYHGIYMLGQHGGDPSNYKSWQFPSWTNPIRFPGGKNDPEIIRIRVTVSNAYFDQEYGAKFTSFVGQIYEEWDDRIHCRPLTFDYKLPNYLGFDFGFANPFVCLDIQVDSSESVYVWREYYESQKSTFEHGNILLNRTNPENYHIDGMWGDPRGANEIATLALMLGNVAAQDIPWKLGVEAIKRLLKPGNSGQPKLFVDPAKCPNLARQMGQLHVKEMSNKTLVTGSINEYAGDGNIQHKVDDHAADALRYMIGPYYVLGAGSHLEDIYGQNYIGSESQSFFTLRAGVHLGDSDGFTY